jgi:hypothetical protein
MRDDWHGDEYGGAGLMFGLMSILLASVIGVIIFAVTISPSGPSSTAGSGALLPFVGSVNTLPGGASLGSGLGGVPSVSQTAACEADGKSVEVALQAYDAVNGTFPTPPSPWSAATYQADYAPLTAVSKQGPFLHLAPPTTSYVVEYDSAGNVWVEPRGQYDATYNPAHSVDVSTSCSSVAR